MVNAREILHSSETVEWFTPHIYIEAAREVMGSIDLDPASCDEANEIVKATKYYTIRENGLVQPWSGNVFMNCPYGRKGQSTWTAKIIEEFKKGNIEQAIVLVNAATGNKWFEPLWQYPICFVRRRIKFITPGEESKHSPTHSNVFVYLGNDQGQKDKFAAVFKEFGPVVTEIRI